MAVVNAALKITWSEKVEYLDKISEAIHSSVGVDEMQDRRKTDGVHTRRCVDTSSNLKGSFSKHLLDGESNDKLREFLKEKKSFFRFIGINNDQMRNQEKGLYYKHKHIFIDTDNPPSCSGTCAKIIVEENNF